jgi:atypical dual specificity phosphatase
VPRLRRLGVQAVLSVVTETNLQSLYAGTNIKHWVIPLPDREDADFYPFFPGVCQFIQDGLRDGAVLVHCMAGVSRSPTAILAFLMQHWQVGLIEAYKHLKARKDMIKPNRAFADQLRAYEADLFPK